MLTSFLAGLRRSHLHRLLTSFLGEQLVELQKLMADGDPRALKVYEALGIEFGYTLAHFAEFYDYDSLLIMGRVTSGP